MDLHLSHVSHRYGGVEVLDDIDFTVVQSHIVCIIGPSGCGKSTLLRLIGGLEPAQGEMIGLGQSLLRAGVTVTGASKSGRSGKSLTAW